MQKASNVNAVDTFMGPLQRAGFILIQ